MKKISVITVNFNQPLTEELLSSISLINSFKNIETIVVYIMSKINLVSVS